MDPVTKQNALSKAAAMVAHIGYCNEHCIVPLSPCPGAGTRPSCWTRRSWPSSTPACTSTRPTTSATRSAPRELPGKG